VHHPLRTVMFSFQEGSSVMSSQTTKERTLYKTKSYPIVYTKSGADLTYGISKSLEGKQITVSEGHRFNRKSGHYDSGGPFFTCRIFNEYDHVEVPEVWGGGSNFYRGPVYALPPSESDRVLLGGKSGELKFESDNESNLKALGTTAISLTSPINPASNLGTTMAEMVREGITLPGHSLSRIQSWKDRTAVAKAAGSEYLNYQFGWAPLHKEVTDVAKAARDHRDIMKQYHAGEGKNTHRRFDFPSQSESWNATGSDSSARFPGWFSGFVGLSGPPCVRQLSRVRETKRWFEGCFTYALPSQSDSWAKHLGFGSEADQLFGLALTPTILWELTPWSWAVDWFSNAGEVINNVTNFGAAGLVLRYGYMMEETIDTYSCTLSNTNLKLKSGGVTKGNGPTSRTIVRTKRRTPSSPFGFSVGWEGLSPTQLAITAALGITKLL
jgi:hypothetical protein